MYQNILFDLDGTVTDPGVGITNSVMYALEKFNIKVTDPASLYKFIGPPLPESFASFYQFDPEQCERAVTYYREYYKEKGIYENVVYPGMDALLKEIKASGRNIILATSKPELFSVEILKHFHLDSYFDFVAGATMDGSRCRKEDIIKYAIDQCDIQDVTSEVKIGDREYDISGAKATGMDSIGVLYGYGEAEELAGATYLAYKAEDIMGFL